MSEGKKVALSVTEFAVPAPRRGSIDAYSGFGRSQQLGIELHQRVQAARIKTHPNYRAEVATTHEFPFGNYRFEISGRMDGVFDSDEKKEDIRIEEIKSSFNIYELAKRIRESGIDHPYCLQLLTYGYIYWQQNQKTPKLNLHLISSRTGESLDVDLELKIKDYESWLERRLLELVDEVKRAEKRIKRRKKAAQDFQFPFENPRSGQVELIHAIEEGMKQGQPMLLQAPTGLGKTVGVLYPTLQEALTRGQKVVYLTPKNSQHAVAEEAVDRLQDKGANIKGMTITAKSKMCFKNEPLCNPDYCEFAKDHYTKVADHQLLDKLSKKKRLSQQTFRKMGEEFQVCPFELQLDAAEDVDTVICDYNYVFAPRSAFGRLTSSGLTAKGKPNLVIDEAHNLPSRAMDYYSPSLSVATLEKMRADLNLVPLFYRRQVDDLFDACINIINECTTPGMHSAGKIHPPIDSFLAHDSELRTFLSNYLNSHIDIEPGDPVMRLCFYWSEFAAALQFVTGEHPEFFTTYTPNPANIKITCCDASEMLKASYKDYAQVIGFSATLKPFSYYSQMSGFNKDTLKTAEFISPFPKTNRKLLIIPQISSKYSERSRNYPRIAEAIQKIIQLKAGNYIAFFPSFDFMENVARQFRKPDNFQILKQDRSMKRNDIETVLDCLKNSVDPHILFAVQGGVFSEGVDYPGEMIIGAFIVGPPLPNFDLERESMRAYYEEHYQAGFDFAYVYPAMAKAVQAAGRVIRSENDKGLIVLMDNRFIQPSFAKAMPQDWYESDPREAVSEKILQDVTAFWRSHSAFLLYIFLTVSVEKITVPLLF
ncbi:MAG: ATP-dependent DNA helicase [Bdellovibrionaceae bacterium]|nr:ATP-dependent DNA helicase [Pseudobdellovibrionaceae bacterium]